MFQNPILNEIINRYRENKLAHAYLIETNHNDLALKEIKELAKILNCPNEYQTNCTDCNLCNLIEKENLPNLKIIEPDGATIKKGQIEELKIKFSTIPVYSKFNIYIINYAEKLNSSSANAMLKFLEEPSPGIIGFFITNNKDIMIDTIKSRCQSISLKYNTKNLIEKLGLAEEEYNAYLRIIKNYLPKIDSKAIINHKKELLTEYPERKNIEYIIKIIFEIYYQNFLKTINQDYEKELIEVYEIKETKNNYIKKLNIITQILNEMSYNINLEQELDKFVIEMRECNG